MYHGLVETIFCYPTTWVGYAHNLDRLVPTSLKHSLENTNTGGKMPPEALMNPNIVTILSLPMSNIQIVYTIGLQLLLVGWSLLNIQFRQGYISN